MTETNLTKAIVGATDSKAEGERAAAVVEKAAETDPVLLNTLNEEPWYQSGVGFFASGGAGWSLFWLFKTLLAYDFDFLVLLQNEFDPLMMAMGAIFAFAGVLYRRFVPGLKPMFSGWLGAK